MGINFFGGIDEIGIRTKRLPLEGKLSLKATDEVSPLQKAVLEQKKNDNFSVNFADFS